MSNPVQVNMYGIRYFIDGDLSDPLVKKLMVQARNDLQQMKDRNINNIPHIWLNKPNAYKIVSQFGIDSAYINVPVLVGEKHKKEKEVYKIEKEETYRFVPAIYINTPELLLLHAELPYYFGLTGRWHYISDVSVCSDGNWNGAFEVIKDSEMNGAGEPGTVCKDGTKTDDLEVIACYNWGNADFYWSWDCDYDGLEDTISQTLFNPAPYLGHSLNGGEDYAWEDALAGGAVYYWTIGTPVPICPGVEADIEAADEGWDSTGLYYARNDDYVVSYDPPQCKNDWWEDTYLVFRYRCGAGHLFFEYEVEGWQEHRKVTGLWYYMGLCFGYGDTYCYEAVNTWPVARTSGGGGQTREWTEHHYLPYFGYSYVKLFDDDLQRSDGEFYFDFDYFTETTEMRMGSMTAPCETSQSDTYNDFELYPSLEGFPGAYIQDIGEPEYICPVESFYNKYFLMIVEEYWEYVGSRTCSPWNVTGYGYDAGGVYDQGSIAPCPGTGSDEETQYRILCINLNGERIEIDTGDDELDYFEVSDSLILDFMGQPVYMYAYKRYRYTNGGYDGTYTRYGYFLNDKHYQSEKFYPAGITNSTGRITNLHDVYGSMNIGKYGYGKCSGYIIKEMTIKKGSVSYEPEIF